MATLPKHFSKEYSLKELESLLSVTENVSQFETGRYQVASGLLEKVCRKKRKYRQFYLFSDVLIYGSPTFNDKICNVHSIVLSDVKAEQLLNADGSDLENFGFVIKSSHKSFILYASSHEERDGWVESICEYADKCRADQKCGEAKPFCPVWAPDQTAAKCMHCNVTEFTLINRRHHCRNCGIVCCNSCSNRRWPLSNQSKSLSRVCTTCYNKLLSIINTNSAAMQNQGCQFYPHSMNTTDTAAADASYSTPQPHVNSAANATYNALNVSHKVHKSNEQSNVVDEHYAKTSNGSNLLIHIEPDESAYSISTSSDSSTLSDSSLSRQTPECSLLKPIKPTSSDI